MTLVFRFCIGLLSLLLSESMKLSQFAATARTDLMNETLCKRDGAPPKVGYSVNFRASPKATVVARSEDQADASYGFYYPTPWNRDESLFLSTERPKSIDTTEARVSLFVYNRSKKVKIGESAAFNTPEGARLQWIGPTNMVSYNIRTLESFASVVASIDFPSVRIEAHVPVPVYSIAPGGKLFASVNFARTYCMSSEGTYGYHATDSRVSSELLNLIPDDDGIRIYDFDESYNVLLRAVVTPATVVSYLLQKGSCLANNRRIGQWIQKHYVWLEQPKFSSNSKRVVFIARAKRCIPGNTIEQLHMRKYINLGMFTVDIDGQHLWYADGNSVSHFDFDGENLLLCGNDGMAVVRDQVGTGYMFVSKFSSEDGRADLFAGHCTFHPAHKHLILTDTSCTQCTRLCRTSPTCKEGYRGRYIGVLDTKQLTLQILGKFSVNVSVPENAFIDLHPRFSPSGREVMIDSQHSGTAEQYVLPFGDGHDALQGPTLAAVLYELNCDSGMEMALRSALSRLPNTVVYVMQTAANKKYLAENLAISRLIRHERIQVVNVEPLMEKRDTQSRTKRRMRKLLYTPEFWEHFPEDYLLWFHADTMFCSQAEDNLRTLLNTVTYPYLGPSHKTFDVLIGGASLRHKSAFWSTALALQSNRSNHFLSVPEDMLFGQFMGLSPHSDRHLSSIGNSFFADVMSIKPRSYSNLIAVHFHHSKLPKAWGLGTDIEQHCPGVQEFVNAQCIRGNGSCLWCS